MEDVPDKGTTRSTQIVSILASLVLLKGTPESIYKYKTLPREEGTSEHESHKSQHKPRQGL